MTEKEKAEWENGLLISPLDSSRFASPTKRKPILLSASILDKFSPGKHQSSDITVPESSTDFLDSSTLMPPSIIAPTLIFRYWLWRIVGHILGSIHMYTLTLRYTHISTFPGRSGTLVPVTHAARQCTAFNNLRSLAQSRRSRVCYCCERMETMCSFWQFRRLPEEI